MSEIFTYDNLIAGSQQDIVNRKATIALGEDLSRGALLGRILRAIGDADPSAGNTGDGTIGSAALGAKAKVGVYTITCTAAGPPGVFSVVDPDGYRLDDATAEVAYDGPIAFLIEAYGDAFIVGDSFTVEVETGSLYCVQADLDLLDGSAEPFGVLAEDVDASLAATLTTVYVEGEFSETGVTYGPLEDADDWRELCAAVGIRLRATTEVS